MAVHGRLHGSEHFVRYASGMLSLRFRLPGREAPLGHWLKSLFPELDRQARRDWVAEGCIRVDGGLVDRPSFECPAGSSVEVTNLSQVHLSALAAICGRPVGQHARWIGLVDEPAWPSGVLRMDGMSDVEFMIGEVRGGLARIQLTGAACSAETMAALLAEAQLPLVADFLHGGLAVIGGLRLSGVDGAAAFDAAEMNWPQEPAWCDPMRRRVRSAGGIRGFCPIGRVIRRSGSSRVRCCACCHVTGSHWPGPTPRARRVWPRGSGRRVAMNCGRRPRSNRGWQRRSHVAGDCLIRKEPAAQMLSV